ncbi:E3 ubiquitin-protein ligase TRIM71-like [Patiria miniata]|uniref:Uncharacterized protein n=1 Tax=Patiria miniata TaxID=46514 RepID=A0A914AMZ4_PATMI|nr:E3 ubiquitin-protein ligase TRIM71-like [Patiria miniata]
MAESMAHLSLTGVRGEVADLLTCPLCYERYDNTDRAPKFLPCLHGFCVGCLAGLVRGGLELKCPLCRQGFSVPEGGVQNLPENFIVGRLKPLEHLLTVDVTRPHGLRCGSCVADGGPAVSFCSDHTCLTFLCQNCNLAHRTMRKFNSHTVASLEQLQEHPEIPLPREKLQCDRHKNELLSVYCNEKCCQRAMCIICVTTCHQGHRVVDLEQKSSETREELHSLAQRAESKKVLVELISGSISTENNQTSTQCEEMTSTVEAVFDRLQSQLKTRREAIIADLRKLCVDRADQLKHPTNIAESLASQFDSACQFAERACDIGNHVDLLKTRAQIISRLHELIDLDVHKAIPFHPANEAFLSFTEDHNRVLSEIERLIPSLGQINTSITVPALTPNFQVDFPGGTGPTLAVKSTHIVRIRPEDPSQPSLDRLKGALHAYSQSPDGSSVECKGGEQCGDFFELEFQPLVVGLHQLNISASGVPIEGSPFKVDVIENQSSPAAQNPSPMSSDKQVLSSDVTWTDAFAGVEHTVIVKLFGPESLRPQLGSLCARYVMPDCDHTQSGASPYTDDVMDQSADRESQASIQQTEYPGTFRIVYTPPAAGKLFMTITVDGTPIPRSPCLININPLHPDSTLVSSPAMGKSPQLTAVLDMPYSMTLLTQDYQKKRLTTGGYDVTATLTTSSFQERPQRADVTDNQDGSYTVAFTPRCTEPHIMQIKICGHSLMPGMSLVVVVQDSLPFVDPPGGYKAPSGLAVDRSRNIVYVADGKNGCIHRLKTDGSSMPEGAISICQRRTLQIAVNSEGKLLLLVPNSKCVITCSTEGEEELRWPCVSDNEKPANLTVSTTGNVIVGDSQTQTLFVYGAQTGATRHRIQLPDGSLAPGMSNVCVDRATGDILVATHSEPFQLIRSSPESSGEIVFRDSPARSNQLALVSTPEGALIIAVLGGILILGPGGSSTSVREIKTDHIYTGLALAEQGFFVAIDPGEKHLAKYSYTSQQPNTGHEIDEEIPKTVD